MFSYQYTHQAKLEAELRVRQTQVQNQLQQLETKSNINVEQQKQIDDLNKQKQELEKQLQAKKESAMVLAEAQAVQTAQTSSAQATKQVYSLPANQAKAFIYQHESGNNPNAVNSIGCRGIGQACPGSKLPCGADYACQDAWFTNYAMTRYGSWEAAYQFWIAHRWW
jgi:TolA-binding protein